MLDWLQWNLAKIISRPKIVRHVAIQVERERRRQLYRLSSFFKRLSRLSDQLASGPSLATLRNIHTANLIVNEAVAKLNIEEPNEVVIAQYFKRSLYNPTDTSRIELLAEKQADREDMSLKLSTINTSIDEIQLIMIFERKNQ